MIRKSLTLVSILTFTAVWSACDSSSEEPAGPPEGFTHISCLDVDGACHQILSGDADDLQQRTNLLVGVESIKALLVDRVKRCGGLIALFAVACAPLRGGSFGVDRPDGRTGLFSPLRSQG
ncbi:MAG: hypothetical protein HOI20_10065 [Gemmatimonadetes bacterium]|jgi:hypothetical protein|nr:hypothetical protein [Gemmatimonadota bacterium]MBT5801931.1 hypothetical protein [Gemmatimonadota bacterium]MBT6623844.1 hypothetical protein [Gemmatimonadota bacterium]MBT6907600.1 hypothetical protein [Gemmatimonadota bacterium]MBT7421381.1 hypothetical protein [Gemmatimonadota bacterium]